MHQTTKEYGLSLDINGDWRTAEEAEWPIKAQCISCGGRGSTGFEDDDCPRCKARGYYFFPLGD